MEYVKIKNIIDDFCLSILIRKLYFCDDFRVMKNLVIDLGNTKLKAYVFEEGKIFSLLPATSMGILIEALQKSGFFKGIDHVIVSSVRADDSVLVDILSSEFENVLKINRQVNT